MRSRQASVASSAETLRAAIAAASSPRVRSVTRRSGVERRDEIRRLLAEGELAAHALDGAGQGGEVGLELTGGGALGVRHGESDSSIATSRVARRR